MKKRAVACAALAAVLVFFSSCVSTNKTDAADIQASSEKSSKKQKAKPVKKSKFDQDAFDEAYANGDYAVCAGMLLGKGDKKNLVKNSLDADMLVYFTQNYTTAGKSFLDTYAMMQQTVSEMTAGKGLAASLGGENSIKYYGAEYERYLAWSMRLASALAAKENDVANGIMKDYVGTFMDEIQALRAQNEEIARGSEEKLDSDEFKRAAESLESAGLDLGVSGMVNAKPAAASAKYESSPFFNYLGTLAYAANKDFDHAQEFAALYNVDKSLVNDAVKVPAGKGRLEVVAFSGTIGRRSDASEGKTPSSFSLPISGVGIVTFHTKVAYPVFKEQKHAIDSVRVTLSNGESKKAVLVEDFDEAVKIDVAQKARGAYSRSVFRNVVKNSAAAASVIAAGIAVRQASDNAIASTLAQIVFSQAVAAASEAIVNLERADIRQGVYFPNKASAAGFSVDPGIYAVTLEYMSGPNVVEKKTIEKVVVEGGKVNVEVSLCEK